MSQKTFHLWLVIFDIHDPIAIIFGRNVTKSDKALFFHLTYLVLLHYLAKEETQKTAHWCFMHATQSNCCSALNFLSPEPCHSKSLELNALITRFRSHSLRQREYESWVKKTEEVKLRLVTVWQCINTASEKNAIFVFPVLPDNAEAQVTWGGVAKRLLIAYFIGHISAKKYQNPFHVCQSYSKPMVGRFLRHGVVSHKTSSSSVKQKTAILE